MWTEMVNVRKAHMQIIRDTSENIQEFGNTYGAVIFELFMYHLRLIGVTTSMRGLTRKKLTDSNIPFLPTHLNTRYTFHNYLDLISPRVCPLQITVKYSFFVLNHFQKSYFDNSFCIKNCRGYSDISLRNKQHWYHGMLYSRIHMIHIHMVITLFYYPDWVQCIHMVTKQFTL